MKTKEYTKISGRDIVRFIDQAERGDRLWIDERSKGFLLNIDKYLKKHDVLVLQTPRGPIHFVKKPKIEEAKQ